MGTKSMADAYQDMRTNLAKTTVAVPRHLQGASALAWWESPDSLLAKTSISGMPGAADPAPATAGIQSEPVEDPTLTKSYAYTPKDGEPKLDISDAHHVAMACAALSSGGFRGNQVEIPEGDRAKVKAKVRAAWKKFNPGKDESEMPESIRKSMGEGNDNQLEKSLGYLCQDCGETKPFEDMKQTRGVAGAAVSPDFLCKNCAAKYEGSSTTGKAVTKVKRAAKAAVSAFVEPFTVRPTYPRPGHRVGPADFDKSAAGDELQKSLAQLEALADSLLAE